MFRRKAMAKIVSARGKKKVSAVVVPLRKKLKNPRPFKMKLRTLANKVALLNGEKKDTGWILSTEFAQAQIIGTGAGVITSGHYDTSLAVKANQGFGGTQRVGDKISVTGMYNIFQFQQQANALQPCRVKVIFATPQFSSYSSVVAGASTNGIETLLNPNPMIYAQSGVSVYDTLCSRNQDYIKDWRILRTQSFTIRGDTISGQKNTKTVKVGLKFKNPHTIHYAPGTTNVISGDIRCFILFENGNAGVAVANGTVNNVVNTNAYSVPVKDANSGWLMCYMSKTYYLDE